MDKLWLALAAWGAGVLVALLGFLESKEKFEPRKFADVPELLCSNRSRWRGYY